MNLPPQAVNASHWSSLLAGLNRSSSGQARQGRHGRRNGGPLQAAGCRATGRGSADARSMTTILPITKKESPNPTRPAEDQRVCRLPSAVRRPPSIHRLSFIPPSSDRRRNHLVASLECIATAPARTVDECTCIHRVCPCCCLSPQTRIPPQPPPPIRHPHPHPHVTQPRPRGNKSPAATPSTIAISLQLLPASSF